MAKVKYKAPTSGMSRMVKKPEAESRPSISMTEVKGEIYYLSPEIIIPYKNQARREFDDESLNELALSIKSHGIIQPLQIIQSDTVSGKFEVVSGERRLRAAQILDLDQVPCMILDKDKESEEIALIENIQRKNLHPIELADAISVLVNKKGHGGQSEVANTIGVSKQQISHYMSIASLPQDVKDFLIKNKEIKVKQLRDLSYLKNEEDIRRKVFGASRDSKKLISILRLSTTGSEILIDQNKSEKLSEKEKQQLKEALSQIIRAL